MANIKISIELSLDEIRNLWYLMENTREFIKWVDKSGSESLTGLANSQERNLFRLKDLHDKIEPIAER